MSLSLVPSVPPRPLARGVAIDVVTRPGSRDAPLYLLFILDAEGRPARTVAATDDEDAACRAWRILSRRLRTPPYVAVPEGGFRPLAPAKIAVGMPHPRRVRRVRARWPAMRSTGNFCGMPVHRDEREIISYE